MKYIYTILILIFVFSYSSKAQLKEFEIKVMSAPAAIDLFPDYPDDAALIIFSSLPNLSFESSTGGIVNIKSEPNKYKLIIKTEKQSILVKGIGFIENRISIPKLEAKDVRYFKIEGKESELSSIPINIRSIPEGAKIYIDGDFKGTNTTQTISKGVHEIRLELEGYRTIKKNIEITSTNNTLFEYKMEKLKPSMITIKSIPEGAAIFVEGKDRGQTNKQLFLTEGIYHIKLTKSDFNEIDTSISVTQDVNKEIVFNLPKVSCRLTLLLTPKDANIEIDKRNYNNLSNIDLSSGEHFIDISKEGYEPYNEIINLEKDQQLTKTINLKPLYGSIQLTVQPINATVRILKNGKELYNWVGSNDIDTILCGRYDLEVSAPLYKKFTRSILIEEEKPFSEDIDLANLTFDQIKIKKITADNNILSNLSFRMDKGKYYITYNLAGDNNKKYNVNLYLLDGSNKNFEKKLINVSGDINKGSFAGDNRSIIWDFSKEFNVQFYSDDLYLKLTAEEAGGNTWYYVIGTAILGGGAAAYLLSHKTTGEKTPDATGSTIPDQPGRP